MPGAGGHRVFVLRVGDSSIPAGHTATAEGTAGGWHLWVPQAALGAPSPARHSQSSSQPCRLCPARIAAGEPCGCHKRGKPDSDPSINAQRGQTALCSPCPSPAIAPERSLCAAVPPRAVVTVAVARGSLPCPAAIGPALAAGTGSAEVPSGWLLGSSGGDEPQEPPVVSIRGADGAGGAEGRPAVFWSPFGGCAAP